MKKEYTVQDFALTEENICMTAFGYWESNPDPAMEKYCINYSSILTRLIQEAGKHCNSYASDLFVSWELIVKEFKNIEYKGGRYLFGFRDTGVDHDTYVINAFNNQNVLGDVKKRYKTLWILEINIENPESLLGDKKIIMKLGKIDINKF